MSRKGGQLRQYDYVDHMIEAIRLIDSYLEDMSYEAFLNDRKTQQAVIFNLLVIGGGSDQDRQRVSRLGG